MDTFRQFYIENKEKVFGYLVRLSGDVNLSADILQESFTRMLAVYGTNELKVSLLYTIARNALMDTWRKNRWDGNAEEADVKDDSDPEKQIMIREAYTRVIKAMKKLEDVERDVLSMAASSDMTYKEIAKIVGISEANVRVKVHRARARLRKILKET